MTHSIATVSLNIKSDRGTWPYDIAATCFGKVRTPCDGGIMAQRRHPNLAYRQDGFIRITNRDELELLVACRGSIADREDVAFEEPGHHCSPQSTIRGYSAASAIERVIATGILPTPKTELPIVGTMVQTMEVGGKPPPARHYGVGLVMALEWDWFFRSWRVEVKFDQPTGGWYGYPILGTHTFPFDVHVIGSSDRPFSDMSPEEIKTLHEVRRQQFWREIDPASGLHDPSGTVRTHE